MWPPCRLCGNWALYFQSELSSYIGTGEFLASLWHSSVWISEFDLNRWQVAQVSKYIYWTHQEYNKWKKLLLKYSLNLFFHQSLALVVTCVFMVDVIWYVDGVGTVYSSHFLEKTVVFNMCEVVSVFLWFFSMVLSFVAR